MRSLAIILALVGVSLASEAGFLNFAKTFNKKYGSTEEYNKRRAIFLENYNDMVRHNKEYEEGKVSWWRKVTELYDLTAEEREVALNLGVPPKEEGHLPGELQRHGEAQQGVRGGEGLLVEEGHGALRPDS